MYLRRYTPKVFSAFLSWKGAYAASVFSPVFFLADEQPGRECRIDLAKKQRLSNFVLVFGSFLYRGSTVDRGDMQVKSPNEPLPYREILIVCRT